MVTIVVGRPTVIHCELTPVDEVGIAKLSRAAREDAIIGRRPTPWHFDGEDEQPAFSADSSMHGGALTCCERAVGTEVHHHILRELATLPLCSQRGQAFGHLPTA